MHKISWTDRLPEYPSYTHHHNNPGHRLSNRNLKTLLVAIIDFGGWRFGVEVGEWPERPT